MREVSGAAGKLRARIPSLRDMTRPDRHCTALHCSVKKPPAQRRLLATRVSARHLLKMAPSLCLAPTLPHGARSHLCAAPVPPV